MFWIWTALILMFLYLISPRTVALVGVAFVTLVVWNWLYDPQLQDYKRTHPEWARAHPEANPWYCFSKRAFFHSDPKCEG